MIYQSMYTQNAAVYARYSSDLQDNSSIDGQIRKARDWAEKNGFTIHEKHRFVDEAISGTKDRRPGLDQMLTIAEQGEFELLVVESLSRLARNLIYASTVMMHLVYVLKIRIVGIDDGCDTNIPNWELLAGIKNILNEQYIRDLGKMVHRGQVENLVQGFSNGDLCFGYKSETVQECRIRGRHQSPKKRYAVDEEQATWVKKIFDWYVNENRSLQWIAAELTRHKVPKDHRATTAAWTPAIVRRVLSNQKYIGIWSWGQNRSERNPINGKIRRFKCSPEEIVQYTRKFPNLNFIDEIQFTTAQELLSQNRTDDRFRLSSRRETESKYLLSDLIKCKIGGGVYHGGGNNQYIRCWNRMCSGRCENKISLHRILAENLVLQKIDEILRKDQWGDILCKGMKKFFLTSSLDLMRSISSQEKKINELNRKIELLLDQIENGNNNQNILKRIQRRTDECRQAEKMLRKLHYWKENKMPIPDVQWIHERIDDLLKILATPTAEANNVLKEMTGGIITVLPVEIPGKKRRFLRGTIHLQMGNILSLITGIQRSEKDIEPVEKIIIDFRKTNDHDEQRRKVMEFHGEGWTLNRIAEKIGLTVSYVSKLIKEDYQIQGKPCPDFRKQKKTNNDVS